MAEFNTTTPEQMKCLVWIYGLHTPEDADIRAPALRKMEDNPKTPLRAHYRDLANLEHYARCQAPGQSFAITPARNQCSQHEEEPHAESPSPYFRCGRLH